MTDYIGYEALTQAAMRGVVRETLRQTAANGAAPGEHHFYITFRTKAPGVKMADHLIERFPDEMTIVIQHQFWDLEVHDSHFELILKFSGVPQHLSIPYAAMTRFVDPAVNFGLSFEKEMTKGEPEIIAPASEIPAEAVEPTTPAAKASGDDSGSTVVSIDAFRRK
ncbi:MAG TPA: stringent starvation protein B [Henriciella marina]|uniref:SspB family protein n=1 Tax=Henriciella sp. TaxID=1968823 RepID=UPI00184EC8D9|nr:ClpXP protease specificity-enhancing factor SspB [Henriciella sp.]HIG20923.1 stringent starvation protein B [Henriciella sp.]HIK63768.1 stringent starvation protein B [Henriciella marina]